MRQSLFVLFLLGGLPNSVATPLQYQLSLTAPAGIDSTLDGATLELSISWDSAILSPTVDRHSPGIADWLTVWPASNTTAVMTISGAGAYDGVYAGQFPVPNSFGWKFFNNHLALGDALDFPVIRFPFEGDFMMITSLEARFSGSYYQGLSTISPKPFTDDEVDWSWPFFYLPNASWAQFTDISGFASLVPEPSGVALATIGLLGTPALRRRK